MGLVYLATFTKKINQNVGKYTIHGSYGQVAVWPFFPEYVLSKAISTIWTFVFRALGVYLFRNSAFEKYVLLLVSNYVRNWGWIPGNEHGLEINTEILPDTVKLFVAKYV